MDWNELTAEQPDITKSAAKLAERRRAYPNLKHWLIMA